MRRERDTASFVAPIRLINCLWLIIVGGLWMAANHFGTPHLRIQYTWSGSKSYPTYHACSYWGLHSFRVEGAPLTCPLLVLARASQRS